MFQNSNEGVFFIGLHHKAAKFSHFSNLKTRLDSFNSWLKKIPTKESLAEAGFFYTEQRDIVICFFCGGGLLDWQEDDNSWFEHKKYFPDCEFLSLGKDESKIENDQDVSLLCKICFDKQSSCLFLPCRHICSCSICALSLSQCIICRTNIISIIKVYIS